MATCAPGTKPARSMASTSVSSACSLVAKSGHQPPSSATPACEPRALHQLACAAIDLGGPLQRLAEVVGAGADDHEVLDVDAPPGMRAAAEDLDLRHRQQRGVVATQRLVQRHAALTAATACAAAIDTASVALAPSRVLAGVPSRSIRRWSSAAWSSAGLPSSARAISPLTFATARMHVQAAEARASPSRSSSASRVPLDAPAGTMARPTAPVVQRDFRFDGRPAAAVPDAAGMD